MEYEIILSGPLNMREPARAALTRAGVKPSQFVQADHGFHPDHVEPGEGFLAYRAEDLEAANAAQGHGWRLRLHRDSTPLQIVDRERPRAAALDYVQGLETRLRALEASLEALRNGGPPPIGGGTLESPPYAIAADQHSAQSFRYPFQSLMSSTGVVNALDLEVTANSPVAMNVRVFAGLIWIPGTLGGSTGMGTNAGAQTSVGNTNGGTSTSTGYPTTFTSQSNYLAYQDGGIAIAVNSADPTNPRIDLVCASVQDGEYAGTSNQCVLQVVTGTAAASPAPPVPPASSVVLGSVWVPAAATSIQSTYINDLRPRVGVNNTIYTPPQTYTPTWTGATANPTLGNGTMVASYILLGSLCFVRIAIAFGTTTNSGEGALSLSLPFAAASDAEQEFLCKLYTPNDSTGNPGSWQGVAMIPSGTSNVEPLFPVGGGTANLNGSELQAWRNTISGPVGTGVPTLNGGSGQYTNQPGGNFELQGFYVV